MCKPQWNGRSTIQATVETFYIRKPRLRDCRYTLTSTWT